jgi:hypothetical protein
VFKKFINTFFGFLTELSFPDEKSRAFYEASFKKVLIYTYVTKEFYL